ncbi:MAG: hypothetical protein V4496_03830 [Pseudomonadota bacterium]
MSRSLTIALMGVILFSCLYAYLLPLLGEETRYASVAWRMFVEHQWFIPHWGNNAYLQKTPLLFWCLDLGWWINSHWPWHVVVPLIFSLLTVFYTQKLAQVLFPDKPPISFLAPLTLIAMPFFIDNLGILRFDMMLTLFNMMACYYLIRKNYGMFVLANGLGLLAKGPVIYLFTIPEVFLYCFYFANRPAHDVVKWLTGIMLSVGALMIWWGPIIYQGKSALIYTMLSEQIFARTTGSKGVVKPIWDYLPLLPCFFLPWIFLPSFLRFNTNDIHDKKIMRYLMQIFIICFIVFSLIKTKESRYLLPLAPLMAIFIAARLEKSKIVYALMIMSFLVTATLDLGVTHARVKTQDLTPAVKFIDTLLVKNIPVVSRDPSMPDMQFIGRWQVSLPVTVKEDKFHAWAVAHPNGWVITSTQKNTQHAYAMMLDGCFEQSYSHLDRVLQICSVSRVIVVPDNKINIA